MGAMGKDIFGYNSSNSELSDFSEILYVEMQNPTAMAVNINVKNF